MKLVFAIGALLFALLGALFAVEHSNGWYLVSGGVVSLICIIGLVTSRE